MNSFIIRSADIKDLSAIEILERQLDYDSYSQELIKSSLENDVYYNIVAELDGCIVAYLSSIIIYDESTIIKIVVDKDYRRQGIAERLIKFLETELKNGFVKVLLLEVRSDNIPAVSLYEKLDFKLQGIRKKYYDNLIDAKLYYKEINDN